ncbi:MAG: nucleotidyltransferase domain-containing protein [Bacteroidia bacterium]|nr:nucleotidyltransferase domain-containing protein [Bacteroidia bacterium]
MPLEDLKNIIRDILKNYPIKRAALFGSFSRGEENADSDIDILIEPSKPVSMFDILKMELELSKKIARKIDIVEFSAIKNSIRENVLKNAIAIL